MKRAAVLTVAFCSWTVAARGAGSNIELGIVNNQIVTGYSSEAIQNNDLVAGIDTTPQSVRILNVPLVKNDGSGATFGIADSGWYGQMSDDSGQAFSGPGIAYGSIGNSPSGFAAGSLIMEYLIGSLQEWNGNAFNPAQHERLQGIAGTLDNNDSLPFFTDPAGTETGSWGVIPETITPDAELPVTWRLDAIGSETPDLSPANGIYLVALQASTNQRVGGVQVAPSLPFYFVFDKNDDAQLNAADAYVQNVLLPEPALIGSCAMVGVATLRKRDRSLAAALVRRVDML